MVRDLIEKDVPFGFKCLDVFHVLACLSILRSSSADRLHTFWVAFSGIFLNNGMDFMISFSFLRAQFESKDSHLGQQVPAKYPRMEHSTSCSHEHSQLNMMINSPSF
ncbi:MAG: hypothetical protein ACTSWN_09285 [Promethearchaeota archaeon]